MTTTRLSLLECASRGDTEAWEQFNAVYQPMIRTWLIRHHVPSQNAEEIGQEVLLVVLRKLRDFDHSGNTGAFRRWLRTVTSNQIRAYARKNFKQPTAVGGSEFLVQVENLKDDTSAISRQWDLEHDRYVIQGILEFVCEQFDPKSVCIFKRLVLKEEEVECLAKEFQVSVGSIYSIKSRMMRKIRKVGRNMLDESYL